MGWWAAAGSAAVAQEMATPPDSLLRQVLLTSAADAAEAGSALEPHITLFSIACHPPAFPGSTARLPCSFF